MVIIALRGAGVLLSFRENKFTGGKGICPIDI
jgi:hypothetical protein